MPASSKAGLFQTAHQGTLFLDQVGFLPESVQGKLLKVLEDHAVRRLGSTRSLAGRCGSSAATSEDLHHAVPGPPLPRRPLSPAGRGHRAATAAPPRRGPDTSLLAEHFLGRACADYGLGGPKTPHPRCPRGAPRLSLAGQHPGAGKRDGARRAPHRWGRDHGGHARLPRRRPGSTEPTPTRPADRIAGRRRARPHRGRSARPAEATSDGPRPRSGSRATRCAPAWTSTAFAIATRALPAGACAT